MTYCGYCIAFEVIGTVVLCSFAALGAVVVCWMAVDTWRQRAPQEGAGSDE